MECIDRTSECKAIFPCWAASCLKDNSTKMCEGIELPQYAINSTGRYNCECKETNNLTTYEVDGVSYELQENWGAGTCQTWMQD